VQEAPSDRGSPGRSRRPLWSLRLSLLAAAVLALLAVGTGAVATFATRDVVASVSSELTGRLRPAQGASQSLLTAYVDEETGQRGFVLTGDERFLDPYRDGGQEVSRLQLRLEQLLAGNAEASRMLREVRAAGQTWNTHVAAQIGAVRDQGPAAVRDVRIQREEKRIFDRLRSRLDALRVEVNRLVDAEVQQLATAQDHVDTAMVIALGLAVAALACTVALLWFALTRPLSQLLEQLATVARGDYRRRIDAQGPEEIQRLAEAAETMRVSIVDRSSELAEAQHELGVQNERQRLAADLHDTTIQRLFGLGLKLSALASQHVDLAPTLNVLIEEADEIIRQLRQMIFELEGSPAGVASAAAGAPDPTDQEADQADRADQEPEEIGEEPEPQDGVDRPLEVVEGRTGESPHRPS
jgi:CHASE3 domain sensor protein